MDFDHQQVAANGIEFHVASCGSGDRLALCLHGFPECWYSWRHQMPLLADLGYRVWAPDLRGYGTSSRPPRLQDYAVEKLLDDIGGLIDASGCSEVTLIAHDWGAMLAWWAAMHEIRPLERLVIMNVPHPAVFELAMRSWKQLRKSWYAMFFQVPRLPEALLRAGDYRAIREAFVGSAANPDRFSPEDLRTYRDAAAQPGALTAMLNYYRALVRGGGGERMRKRGYPTIDIPTLMVWGLDDVALSVETTYGTDRYVSDLTLRYLPGVSHWVQQDAPELVNDMLAAWLRGEPVPEAAAAGQAGDRAA